MRCGYQKAVKALGLASVAEISFKRGAKDFSAEELSLKQAGATFIASGGVVAEHSMLLKEAAKNQMPVTFLAIHSAHLTPVQALAGPAGDGYDVADYVPPLTDLAVPGMAKFVALTQKYLSPDEQKALNRYSVTAYVGALLMEDAIRAAVARRSRAPAWSTSSNRLRTSAPTGSPRRSASAPRSATRPAACSCCAPMPGAASSIVSPIRSR